MLRRRSVLVLGLALAVVVASIGVVAVATDDDEPVERVALEVVEQPRRPRVQVEVAPPTTYLLSTPIVPPEEDYYDEEIVALGRLQIPRLGVDVPLHYGMSLYNIDHGPSVWPGTALPGTLGNTVIAGHRVTNGAPFRHLDDLGPGDTATLATDRGTFTYEFVASEVVMPDRVDIATQQPNFTATFYACHPPGSARQRIVVYWRLTSAPAPGEPDPATLPATVFPLPPPADAPAA